jgi:hypothetical protein
VKKTTAAAGGQKNHRGKYFKQSTVPVYGGSCGMSISSKQRYHELDFQFKMKWDNDDITKAK